MPLPAALLSAQLASSFLNSVFESLHYFDYLYHLQQGLRFLITFIRIID